MLTIEQIDALEEYLSSDMRDGESYERFLKPEDVRELIAAARRDADVRTLDEWAEQQGMRSWRSSNDGNDRRVTLYQRGMQERETPAWFAAKTPSEARQAAASAVRKEPAR